MKVTKENTDRLKVGTILKNDLGELYEVTKIYDRSDNMDITGHGRGGLVVRYWAIKKRCAEGLEIVRF